MTTTEHNDAPDTQEDRVGSRHEPDDTSTEADRFDADLSGAAPDGLDGSGLAAGVGSADGSSDGRHPEDSANEPVASAEEPIDDGGEGAAEQELILDPREEAIAERIEERVLTLLVSAAQSTSGPIPSSEDLYSYTPEHQERILRMAEGPTSDESERRDRIVDARIAQSARTLWITPLLMLSSFGAAIYSFAMIENNIAGLAFLAVPVFKFVGSFAATFSMKSKG